MIGHFRLLVGFILVWAVVVGAVISVIVWAASGLPFLPVFGIATGVLVVWSVATSAKNIRGFLRSRPNGGGGSWPEARGTREPRHPRGPTPASSSAADPGESTGPSTIL